MAEVISKVATDIGTAIVAPIVWSTAATADYLFGKKKPNIPDYSRDLKDRTFTITSTEAPHVYVYGRARVGSAIVAVLTSGDRDQYKHVVAVHAAHECDAIEEVYINSKALGTLDGSGYVTSGDYYSGHDAQHEVAFTGTGTTLPYTPISGSLRLFYTSTYWTEDGYAIFEEKNYTLIGSVISGVPYREYTVNYSYNVGTPYVRVLKHLGEVGQVADAVTISEVPTKWNTTKKLSGMCYTIIRLDLNFQDFQSGCPTIEVLVRGKKLHDVRDGSYPNDTPVWSQNNALVIADYLTSEMCNVPWTDLPLADFQAAANVCDENMSWGNRYTANGTVTSDDSQREILDRLAQSMAGTIVATSWSISAGKYIAPVMALSQSDIVGEMSWAPGQSEAELFNGIKGQFISSNNLYVATDFKPYQNSTYVTSDGQELWSDLDFNFTDDIQRVHNICRIFTEDQRNSFTIKADFSYKAWALTCGQRVTFTSSLLGQTNKVYRVIGKSYSGDSPVSLTLKEDAASIWDNADAITEDSTPNTNLPNPFVVGVPGEISVTEELYETTGSAGVKVKAIVTWLPPLDSNVLDYEIVYKSYFDAYYKIKLPAVGEYAELLDMRDGRYDIKIRARNNLNLYSAYTPVKIFTLYGLTALPSDVLNFTIKPFNGSAICSWDKTADLDVKIGGDVEIRYCPLTTGQSWEQSYIIPDGDHNGDATTATVSLATGTYYAKFIDSTGQYSATPASFVVTEALMTGWTTVATTTQDPTFTGGKTNIAYDNNAIKLGGTTLWDDLGLMDTWDEMDTLGGLSPTGTYLFDSTLDLGSVLSRRFHLTMKALSVSISDTIDMRLDLIDLWESFDGGVINGTNATVYASISDDNVVYSEWVPFMVADFKCRYAKFKAVLTSNDSNANIEVSQLRVAVKIPA